MAQKKYTSSNDNLFKVQISFFDMFRHQKCSLKRKTQANFRSKRKKKNKHNVKLGRFAVPESKEWVTLKDFKIQLERSPSGQKW